MSDKSFEDIKKEKMDMLVDMLMIEIGEYIDGKLTKEEGGPKPGIGPGKAPNFKSKGDGSESQEQEWHFHELLPSEIHRKPER